MRFVIALLPVLALACGGGSKSSPPPVAPLPPEEGAAPSGGSAYGAPVEGGAPEEGATAVAPSAPACPPAVDAGSKAPLPDAELDALAKKTIGFLERMAGVFEANPKDCHKLSTELRGFLTANCAELNELRAQSKRASKQQQEKLGAKHGDKMQATMMKMLPAMQNCQNDAELMGLMSEMQAD